MLFIILQWIILVKFIKICILIYVHIDDAGFTSDKNDLLKACFGGGGPYNIILGPKPEATICSDPSKRIYWDGPHLTEAAYMKVAKGLVEGPFANPSLKAPPFKIA